MKLKNILLSGLSLVLVAALAIGGTVAYLQDSDSDVNVMTLGNVKIEQHEYERAIDANGNYETIYAEERGENGYKLTDFTQAKPLYPAVGSVSGWDSVKVCFEQLDGNKLGRMDVLDGINNVQDKFVFVENTGKTDAYVRTLIAYEVGSDTDAFGDLIKTSANTFWKSTRVGVIAIDGNNYHVVEYVYDGNQYPEGGEMVKAANGKHPDGIVHPGEYTYCSLAQVYMASKATNEDVEAIDGNKNGTYDILVVSQAVQAAGFADAKTALDTAFGKSADKAAEWFGGMGKVQFVEAEEQKASIEGEAAAEILKDLEAGNDLIVDKKMDIVAFDTNVVNAQGATVTLNGTGSDAYGYLAFLPDAGEDVAISNLNVTGSGFVEIGHYGMGGGNYTVKNVKIENLASTLRNDNKGFNLGCAFMAYGDVTLNNCVMTGTTAVQDDTIPVDLGCGQAWSGYTDDDDNKISTTINGGEYGTVYCWSHAIVTVNGAEIDTLQAAPIKGTVTIKAGSHVETIKVDYGNLSTYATAANLAKIVIEDGATVDAIVYNDTTYTVAEWNAYVASL